MKAAVIYSPGDVQVKELDMPAPGPNEVLIKVKACGVCGTEHTLFTGGYYANYPVVLGHEYAGEVVEVGKEVRDLKAGDKVTVDPNIVCHRCDYCRMGSEHLCENLVTLGITINGGAAEYSVAPATNVYRVPDSLTFEEAAFCEPLACVVRGLEVGPAQLGDTVLVLGAGSIGNLLMQCAAHAGAANIIVSEPVEFRRRLALENGATHVVDPTRQDVAAELKKIRRIGADVVYECTGNLAVQTSSPLYARRGGTVVLFGVSPKQGRIEINPFDINENELKLVGSFNNPLTQAQALELLATRRVRADNLVSHRVPLANYPRVFDTWDDPTRLKTMVVMG
ncbi:MAG: zinc-dependent alcohol dehydrogenase family protein [Chloroflexi bacterium]|nr:zinc-dependent alcohol dehydrogenase family protein [Chloroflexota bacterium]